MVKESGGGSGGSGGSEGSFYSFEPMESAIGWLIEGDEGEKA